eukprot:CAMPEP_0183726354 /NCGR_PEP_ID=MMETSP0737-20130205/23072_1 /TAXON_ID=385413 /ORGANISM="Thalassiosira miniscula, Strain CCMP1093" /LENGTH=123 /DNA_ID=CAMNT_0025957675 /DNA_START=59 /DNA_END=430 /DNA_ORIENTATION=+
MTFSLFDSDIDFSFAICPDRWRRFRYGPNKQCSSIERTSIILQDFDMIEKLDNYDAKHEFSGDTSSLDSARSVTFADNVVAEIISIPKYEKESKKKLFYCNNDIERFKHEARLEWLRQINMVW